MKTIKNLKAEDIRKSILQLAIQGKLVKQDPNDEPASELVKRIYEEKNRLIKEGKIKKDKNESFIFKGDDNCYYEKIGKSAPVILENLPFEIPKNWTWIRQKEICWLENGEKTSGEKLPYLEAKVIRGSKEAVDINSGIVVDQTKRVILVDGENSGEIMTPPYKGYMGSTFKIFSAVSSFNYEYLLFVFQSNKDKYRNTKIGAAIPHLNKDLFKNSLIAVPPIEEQERIIKQINKIDPLILEYKTYEEKLTKLETEFSQKIKKSILQYAIEGKLVKQDPNDEPASVLLERIKAEKEALIKAGKIKRDKNESLIYKGDDKNYYEKTLRKSVIARLIDVGYITGGGTPSTSVPSFWNGDIVWITPADMSYGTKYIANSRKKITKEGFNNSSARLINRNSIIMSSRAPIGYFSINTVDVCTSQGCKSFTAFSNSLLDSEYVYYYLISKKEDLQKRGSGTTFKEISGSEFGETKIIIYSVGYQKKIVNKLNTLYKAIE